MAILKQSATYTRSFLMIQSSDHITGLTGATPSMTLRVSKAGGAFTSSTGTIAEIANGWYDIGLTTGDTGTVGDLAYHITATSGDPTDFVDQVTSQFFGDNFTANVVQWLTSSVTVNAASIPRVDVIDWLGTGVSAVTAGIPDTNVKNYNNQVAQTDANKLPIVDAQDINGISSSTGTAMLGVNVVNWNAHVAQSDANNLPIVDLQDINGVSSSTTSAQLGVAVVNIGGALSVGTAGYAGLDWAHINAPTTAVDLSGTTVKTIDLSNIKKNAINNFSFIMTDSTTHAPKTGVTVTATRSIDGAAFGACANAVTEIANGWYFIVLAAADTNGNSIALRFTGAACDDQDITIQTQP